MGEQGEGMDLVGEEDKHHPQTEKLVTLGQEGMVEILSKRVFYWKIQILLL